MINDKTINDKTNCQSHSLVYLHLIKKEISKTQYE